MPQITPGGDWNNITINITNDRCNYFGTSGTVLTNVSMSQTQGVNITNANFSQMMRINGLGTTFNLTLEIFNLSSMWQLLQNNSVSIPINDSSFFWETGTTKRYRVNYTAATGLSLKFNVSNTINFTPQIFASSNHFINSSNGPLCDNCGIFYNGTASTAFSSSPIYLKTNTATNLSEFVHTGGPGVFNTSAFGPETATFNYSVAGACEAAYAANATTNYFNASNKTGINNTLYCFPVFNQSGAVGSYTVVKVTANYTNDTGGFGNLVNLSISARMEVPRIFVSPENDPYFDSQQHNMSVYVNGTNGQPVSWATVALVNTSAGVTTNTTNSSGWAVFYYIPSENYTWYAYNSTQGLPNYNVSNTTGLLLNGTAQAITTALQNFDNEGPTVVFVSPNTTYATSSTAVINITFNSSSSNPARINWTLSSVNLSNSTGYWLFNWTNMNCTSANNNLTMTCNATTATLANGANYSINASATDFAGNVNSSTRNFTADFTAASVAVANLSASWVGTGANYGNLTRVHNGSVLLLNVSVSDAQSGVNSTYGCPVSIGGVSHGTLTYNSTTGFCNGTATIASPFEGNLTLNITAGNGAGTVGANDTYMVWVDNTAPSINVTSPANRTAAKSSTSLTFNFSISDGMNLTGASCYVYINGTLATTLTVANVSNGYYCAGTSNMSLTTNGNYTLNATIADFVNNTGFNSSFMLTLDDTAPAVNVSSPSASSSVNGTIQINGSASDTYGQMYAVYYRPGSSGTSTGSSWVALAYGGLPVSFSNYTNWNTSTVGDGWHTINVTVNDTAGNLNYSTILVYVNNTNHTANITTPSSGYQRGSVWVNGSAFNGTINFVSWNLTALNSTGTYSLYNSSVTNLTYGYLWNTAAFADGNYTLRIVLYDTTNKNATGYVFDVGVDNTAPAITSPVVSPSAGGISNYYYFNATLTDSSSISAANATFYNGTVNRSCTLSQFGTTGVYGCNLVLPVPGWYNITVTAVDAVGNANASQAIANTTNITVGSYSHNFSSYSASPASGASGSTVNLSGYAYFAFTNGTVNATALASGNVTFSGCTTGTIALASNGFFNKTFTAASTCTATVALDGTNVSTSASFTLTASATPTPTPSSGGAPTGATATPAPTVVPTAAPTAAPTAEPQAPEEPRILDDATSVEGAFGERSASFTVSYTAGASGFSGRMEFRLPFDYADWEAGLIRLSPQPDSVRPGSIIAVYKSVVLEPNAKFEVKVSVDKAVPKTVLDEFAAPTLLPAGGTPTPSAPEEGTAPITVPAGQAGGDSSLLFFGILVAVLVVAYFVWSKRNNP
jgi:hypothetical protein